VAAGCWSDTAPDGRAPHGQRLVCCLPGERETIPECVSDRAILENHRELKGTGQQCGTPARRLGGGHVTPSESSTSAYAIPVPTFIES